ncbi:hypothetical protein K438DRAFT_1983201 [Mycena galopus ATCC 62051]|nr:hypothetical protein K438DRAFT_1983201 [Mycena galopus ATCC 62051]
MASPDTAPAPDTGTRIYKKMTKAELRTAGLDQDPIFEYTMTELLPLFEAKAQELGSGGTLIQYAKGKLFNQIAAALDLGAQGYNFGAFKETLYNTLKNNRNQLPKKKNGATTKPNKATTSTTKLPKATSAFDKFCERHKAEFGMRTMQELLGVERDGRDGKWLVAFNKILQEEWAAVTDEEKAEMVMQADGKKAEQAAGPTEEDIAASQATAGDDLYKALRARIGNDWGQIGHAAFFLRGVYTNTAGDVKRFFITVGPEDDTPPSLSSDEEKLVFGKWVKKVLKPSASAAPLKKLTDLMLPDLDVDAESPETLKEMLRGLAVKSDIVIEGKLKVDLDAATDEQVREYWRHFLQIQKQGGSGHTTTPPRAGDLVKPAGDNVVPPPPPVGDNVMPPSLPAGDELMPPPPPVGDNVVPPPRPAGDELVPLLPPAGESVVPPLAPAGDELVPPPPPAGDELIPPPPPGNPVIVGPPAAGKSKGKGKGKDKNAEDGAEAQEGDEENAEPPKPAKRRRVAPAPTISAPAPCPCCLRDFAQPVRPAYDLKQATLDSGLAVEGDPKKIQYTASRCVKATQEVLPLDTHALEAGSLVLHIRLGTSRCCLPGVLFLGPQPTTR